jgi:hypothetical protein
MTPDRRIAGGTLVFAILLWPVLGAGGFANALMPTPTATPWRPQCDVVPVPDRGPPGTFVALRGTCYPIHSGRPGAIFFDDTRMARVHGDTPGYYSSGLYVPPDARLGVHHITMRAGQDDGPVVGTATFTVVLFCRGDCNNDGAVTVGEVVRGVAIALGGDDVAACPAADADHDGEVAIDELVGALTDVLTGCIIAFTPTPTPRDTPTPVPPGGACRSTIECDRLEEFLCLEPGGFAGCVECRLEGDQCADDSDCAARGAGLVCEQLRRFESVCYCAPTRICIPGCTSGSDCDEGQRCDAGHHCVAIGCVSDDACPTQFYCHTGGAPSGSCARRYCLTDAECPTGFCVEYGCHDALGTCVARPSINPPDP